MRPSFDIELRLYLGVLGESEKRDEKGGKERRKGGELPKNDTG